MEDGSRHLAKLIGPTLVAVTIPEMAWIQPTLYDNQTPSGIYGAGMLWFIAGWAILREHHLWTRRWPVVITMLGYVGVIGGLARMFGATSYPTNARTGLGVVLGELLVITVGAFLTWKGYRRPKVEYHRAE